MAPPKPQTPRPRSALAPLPHRQSVVPLARPLVDSLAGDDGLASLLARTLAQSKGRLRLEPAGR